MRIQKKEIAFEYKIAVLDDEIGIIDALTMVLGDYGYCVVGFTDPFKAIEAFKNEKYDLLILDYLMDVLRGDKVVEKIREFDKELYILLLTGYKDLAPPLETMNTLDIQAYCEKSNKFDQLILLVTSALKSVALTNTVKRYRDGLNRILQAIPEIYQLKAVTDILDQILSGIIKLVSSEDSFILVDDVNNISNGGYKSIYKGIGEYNVSVETFMERLNPEFMENIGIARTNKETVQFKSGVLMPLINEERRTIGVVFIKSKNIGDNIGFMEIYVKHIAIALSNAFLHSLVNIKNDELNSTYTMLKERYLDAIEVLRLTVDAKDVYTRGHSDRVSHYAVRIGHMFNLDENDIELLRLGGIFHDVGKIGTGDDILFKTEKLNVEEYNEVKRHTMTGAHILSAVSMFKEVVPLVKHHHERVDGKGYPDGLSVYEIPFLARILSVADAFDAMTSDRLYRKKIEISDAINQLKLSAGTQFDAEVVDKFILVLDNYESIQEELSHTYF